MTTFDSVPVPAELAEEVARRRAWGADTHDEVWDGEYRMAPEARGSHGNVAGQMFAIFMPLARRVGLVTVQAFNLGGPRDFRAPDAGVVRHGLEVVWYPTAAVVVEVLSPRDRAWEKLGFYARHEVDELVMVDTDERSVVWMARRGDGYDEVERSAVLDVAVAEVAAAIDWP